MVPVRQFRSYSLDLSEGAAPKHVQLRRIIEHYVENNLSPGDMLPGERMFEEHFRISRITVRRAAGDLVASGKLVRVRGRGTFVASTPMTSSTGLLSFSEQMRAEGLRPGSIIVLASRSVPPPETVRFFAGGDQDSEVALRPAGDEPVDLNTQMRHAHVRRVRLANGVPVSIDDGWYNIRLMPSLLENDVYNSMYDIMSTHYDCPVTETVQTSSAVCADSEQAGLLEVSVGAPLLRVLRQSYSRGRPVEWCVSFYRTDRFALCSRVTRASADSSDRGNM